MLVARAVREIKDAVGHADRGAVGENLVQADGEEGLGPVDGQLQDGNGGAENLEALAEGRRVEGERSGIVVALVGGSIVLAAEGAPVAGGEPHRRRRPPLDRELRPRASSSRPGASAWRFGVMRG